MSKVINFDFTNLNSIPIEIRSLLPHEIHRRETIDAAADAIAKVWTQLTQMRDDNDDQGSHEGSHDHSDADDNDQDLDSDDASFEWRTFKRSKCNRFEFPFEQQEIKDFISSLAKNVVFDMGFRVLGLKPNDEKNCWCPWYVH